MILLDMSMCFASGMPPARRRSARHSTLDSPSFNVAWMKQSSRLPFWHQRHGASAIMSQSLMYIGICVAGGTA